MPSRRARRANAACFEPLEARTLLSYTWTSQEVYLLELVNRARYDPLAEAARLGVDLTQGLTAGELFRLAPSEPLALNEALTDAARYHSQDMADRSYFAHIDPDGLDPNQRAQAFDYSGQAGENIAAGYADIDAAFKGWLASLGHRKNILSLHEDFTADFRYTEFGAGIYFPGGGAPYSSYYTQEFGVPSPQETSVLGVVYDDLDSDGVYSIGEGHAGVRVEVLAFGSATPVATYITDDAGNYQMVLGDGHYTLVFTDVGTTDSSSTMIVVQGQNVKVDAVGPGLDLRTYSYFGAEPAAVANGSAQPGDLLTIATTDRAGRFITFTQDGQYGWYFTDVSSATGAPRPTGQVTTWTRPNDPNTYAAAPSAEGLILYIRDEWNSWTFRNLTLDSGFATNITGEMTSYLDGDAHAHIAGIDLAGQLVLYSELPDQSWTYTNLNSDHLFAQGLQQPHLVGPLISYVTSWGGQNIAGLDESGNIQSIWWAPGMDLWRTDNLSAITGAPALTGGLSVYLTSWGGINLAGADPSGHVSVTWWVPEFGGDWVTTDLTAQFSGPALASASINSYTTPWGGLNVMGLDTTGKIVVYWWAPGMGAWEIAPLTDAIQGATSPCGAIRGVTSAEGTINLLGIREDGHVLRYHWSIGGEWQADDLTSLV